MNQETIDDEITFNGNRKTMLGVRCYPELKFKLTAEAENLGITLSEHCEGILSNKDNILSEKESATHELEQVKQKLILATLTLEETNERHITDNNVLLSEKEFVTRELEQVKQKLMLVTSTLLETKSIHKTELQKVESENKRLKAAYDRHVEEALVMKQNLTLFTNKQLLFLFEKVRGQKDTIDGVDGQQYTVTYNQPKDLLEAMIYSFNYKKP